MRRHPEPVQRVVRSLFDAIGSAEFRLSRESGDSRFQCHGCTRARRALPTACGRSVPLRVRGAREPRRCGGRHPDDVRERAARARAGRPAAQADELVDHDRAQSDSAAVPPAAGASAGGRARPRRRGGGGHRRRPVDRRARPRSAADPADPAPGARAARAGGPLVRRDRRAARCLAVGTRGADLPGAAIARRRAREPRHL